MMSVTINTMYTTTAIVARMIGCFGFIGTTQSARRPREGERGAIKKGRGGALVRGLVGSVPSLGATQFEYRLLVAC